MGTHEHAVGLYLVVLDVCPSQDLHWIYRRANTFHHTQSLSSVQEGIHQSLLHLVCRQGFCDQWRPKLRESLAHLVG